MRRIAIRSIGVLHTSSFVRRGVVGGLLTAVRPCSTTASEEDGSTPPAAPVPAAPAASPPRPSQYLVGTVVSTFPYQGFAIVENTCTSDAFCSDVLKGVSPRDAGAAELEDGTRAVEAFEVTTSVLYGAKHRATRPKNTDARGTDSLIDICQLAPGQRVFYQMRAVAPKLTVATNPKLEIDHVVERYKSRHPAPPAEKKKQTATSGSETHGKKKEARGEHAEQKKSAPRKHENEKEDENNEHKKKGKVAAKSSDSKKKAAKVAKPTPKAKAKPKKKK